MSARTVLIVDDDPDTLENLREAFEHEGFAVVTAPDGAGALVRLRELDSPPCVAILDVLMPRLDGRDLYGAMQRDQRLAGVAVVFCTAAPSEAPEGAIVLKKPINLSRLFDAVRAHC